ncbi:F420-0:Gamma-glutamyl ligase [Cyanobium sp. WAJ14-Wanaka]|uniref:F420-0:Gamma-glutamyl ligase n=1 Tax=Cyanobium sp. WAJ14-Wanaka TaxID=2823725 RepID=UPI0020CFA67E|nr:F420-0:Gamma-glutamyl ligase [Cyanobium sp. WAJ14-Wanaka]MCP9774440.1 F420-0:Gamma-glutamyl ligase [Cyanobium sp. WAJ14-Wanaka]
MNPLLSVLLLAALALGLTLVWLELRHRLRPASPLELKAHDFSVQSSPQGVTVQGEITISNPHRRMEVMVPEIAVEPVLLGQGDLRDVIIKSRVVALHPDEETRPDNYWAAYIVKGRKSTRARIEIQLSTDPGLSLERLVDSLWLDLHWINYGPFGRLNRRDGWLVPLRQPETINAASAQWRKGDNCQVLPLRTHLLGVLDSPGEVLSRYASDLIQPGDVLTIGETPLAVMQGRYHHPATVEPSALARLLCRVFHPTSSLATACGLQSLIDVEGPARVLGAWLIGTALKALGSKGWFYRLAGDQARLIDDITGTTPPYDQTIVLGPEQPAAFCAEMARALGVAVAVVDVNDLGRVKVLAASPGCDEALLQRALRPNPAGNANERTPLVLVRP